MEKFFQVIGQGVEGTIPPTQQQIEAVNANYDQKFDSLTKNYDDRENRDGYSKISDERSLARADLQAKRDAELAALSQGTKGNVPATKEQIEEAGIRAFGYDNWMKYKHYGLQDMINALKAETQAKNVESMEEHRKGSRAINWANINIKLKNAKTAEARLAIYAKAVEANIEQKNIGTMDADKIKELENFANNVIKTNGESMKGFSSLEADALVANARDLLSKLNDEKIKVAKNPATAPENDPILVR